MKLSKKLAFASIFALFVATAMPAQKRGAATQRQVRNEVGITDSVILKNADAPNNVKRLPVLHAYSLGDLRRQPMIRLGDRQVDMKPMLNNPLAVSNVAAKLQGAPQYIKVMKTSSTASEVAQGLVVETDLQFTFAGGACTDSASRAAIDRLGIHCPVRATPPGKGAGNLDRLVPMSHTPSNAATVNRAKYAAYYKQQDTLINQHIAALRTALKDPAKRAKLVAAVGQAKVDQISALTDDQIKDNIASTAVEHIHETIFVPKTAMTTLPPALAKLGSQPSKPQIAAPIASNNLTQPTTDQTLGPDIYLTGFTLGNSYEWQVTFSFDLDPCLLGLDVLTDGLASIFSSIVGVSPCPFHASITPYAGLAIGFGMRFPIKTTMQYHRQVSSKNTAANVRVDFAPFDGSAADYARAGLEQGKIFEGKEFVAELDADAGINYDLPVLGSGNLGISLPLDFTQYLPTPFAGGNFTPPAPGTVINSAPIVVAQFDLLGNLFDLAVLQAVLNPAIEVGLTSSGLSFDLADKKNLSAKGPTYIGGGHLTTITKTGTTVPLTADPRDHSTDFVLTNPYYNLGLEITPGLVLHLGVDLGVWSQSWDPAIWIPALAIEVPSQGINFACHEGTICTHEYQQTSQGKATAVTEADVIKEIQANNCDGPHTETNQFYCRSTPGWEFCTAHASSTRYTCQLYSQDELNQELKSLNCSNGLCNSNYLVSNPFRCPQSKDGICPADETNIAACQRIVSDPGNHIFGYQRCCMNPAKYPSAKGCVAMTAPPPAPILHDPSLPSSPNTAPSHNAPKSSEPNSPGTAASSTPATSTKLPSSTAGTRTPQNGTTVPPKPTSTTPPPTAPKPAPAATTKPGSTTKPVPKTVQ